MAKLYVSKSVRELMQQYEPKPKTKYHNGNYAYYKKMTEPIKRICKKCKTEFEQPKKTDYKMGKYFEYCPDCRDNRKKHIRKNTECLFCGKPLPSFLKSHNHLPFCNQSCQIQFTIIEGQKRWLKYGANLKPKDVVLESKED